MLTRINGPGQSHKSTPGVAIVKGTMRILGVGRLSQSIFIYLSSRVWPGDVNTVLELASGFHTGSFG